MEGDECVGGYALDRESLVGQTVPQLLEQVFEQGVGQRLACGMKGTRERKDGVVA